MKIIRTDMVEQTLILLCLTLGFPSLKHFQLGTATAIDEVSK